MIHEVDEALRTLLRRDAIGDGNGVEVVFDAPTREWATRRNTPTIDCYLYDIREDVGRRESGLVERRDAEGRVTGRVPPPRWFRLSYLVTAWTQRPEDEHRLLSSVLATMLRHEAVPRDVLTGSLTDAPGGVTLCVGMPPAEDRALSDTWSALGGELKPSIDVVVVAPMSTELVHAAGPPVLERLIDLEDRTGGAVERASR